MALVTSRKSETLFASFYQESRDIKMRIAVLWTDLPGYLVACLKALSERHQVELMIVKASLQDNHPLPECETAWIENLLTLPRDSTYKRYKLLIERLREFSPDIMLVSGWYFWEYTAATLALKKHNVKSILCIDNQWRPTSKQVGLLLPGRLTIPHIFDFAWAAGLRQVDFLRHLGFAERLILRGVYSGNTDLFGQANIVREKYMEKNRQWPQQFLFVASFEPWKGIFQLIEAYKIYRNSATNPWTLHCVGGGSLKAELVRQPGIIVDEFLTPSELVKVYGEAGMFILPSLYEPYGVVVHEAAISGLPMLCSTASGAVIDMVRDGYNGYLFNPKDIQHLAHLMKYVSSGQPDLSLMGQHSYTMAQQTSPAKWADYLIEAIHLRTEAGLAHSTCFVD